MIIVSACSTGERNGATDKPRIIEVFACSDNCPGPEEDYIKKVYEGVEDEGTCLDLGGTPLSYVGWGEFFVCLAE